MRLSTWIGKTILCVFCNDKVHCNVVFYLPPTFCFDLQSCSHQCKQSGIKHDCAVTVQRHVHGYQPLREDRKYRPLT